VVCPLHHYGGGRGDDTDDNLRGRWKKQKQKNNKIRICHLAEASQLKALKKKIGA